MISRVALSTDIAVVVVVDDNGCVGVGACYPKFILYSMLSIHSGIWTNLCVCVRRYRLIELFPHEHQPVISECMCMRRICVK